MKIAHRSIHTLALCLAALTFGAADSGAATTVGATLVGTPTETPPSCAVAVNMTPVSCTLALTNLVDSGEAAPGGVTAPSAGILTHWRIVVGPNTSTSMSVKPRILGFVTGFTAVRSGAAQSIAATGGSFTFPDRLLIEKGDRIGFDATTNGPVSAGPPVVAAIATNGYYLQRNPPIADGETIGIPLGPTTQKKLMVQADIEADADADGYGDETQDLCPQRAGVQSACPPPKISGERFTTSHLFQFTSDIPGTVRTTIDRVMPGRKVKGKCKAKARKGKKCLIYSKLSEFDTGVIAGSNSISYAYKVGGKSLGAGRFRASLVITSAQNTVTTLTFNFTIKKSKK